MVHTTPLLAGVLQVPVCAVALLKVTPAETEPVTAMPVAGSSPSFETVNVIATELPAETNPAGDRTGATLETLKALAGCSFTTKASLDPFSAVSPGSGFCTCRLGDVVSPAKYEFRKGSTAMLVPRSVPLPPK